jgi:tRNA-dihydrouridine synthase
LEAGRIIERLGVADAIDINLGCPQPQAVRDHYGSILMEEPELVERIVATAAHGLGLPVTVKMRVLKTGRGQSSLRHSVTVTSVSFSRHVPTANLSGRYCSLCVL